MSLAHRCDGCGGPIEEDEHLTDDSVCGGTDGPGFFLCGDAECQRAIDRLLGPQDRAAYYGAQRALNLEAEKLARAQRAQDRKRAIVVDHVAMRPGLGHALISRGLGAEDVLLVLDTLREADPDLAGEITEALEGL